MPGRRTRSIAELTNRKVRRSYHYSYRAAEETFQFQFLKNETREWPMQGRCPVDQSNPVPKARLKRDGAVSHQYRKKKLKSSEWKSFKTYNIRGKWGI